MLQTKNALFLFLRVFAYAFIAFIPFHIAAAGVPAAGFTFGIGPTQSALELAKRWSPILQYLSEKSGVTLQFKTAKDLPTFQQQIKKGVYDFAYINSYHYVLIYQELIYNAFAREKDGKLYGILVVKKGGPIQQIDQMNGVAVAFPIAAAVAATWLPTNMLNEKGVYI